MDVGCFGTPLLPLCHGEFKLICIRSRCGTFIERTDLFEQYTHNGIYDARSHLAEIIALLGPPPKELIERFDKMIEKEWPVAVRRQEGPLKRNALEMFNGLFFKDGMPLTTQCLNLYIWRIRLTKTGKFLYEELIPSRKLEDTGPFPGWGGKGEVSRFCTGHACLASRGEEDGKRADGAPVS